MLEIKATGLPKTIEEYQLALNAAFAGGVAYGKAENTSENEFAWKSLKDFETDAPYEVNPLFKSGWNMARLKASAFK